jgi:molybdenum cofactor cytidylyltransferase
VIAAVMLAAGLARRMGRQKLLLQLQGKPVVRLSVEHIVSHVEDVVVVTGPEDTAIRQALEGLPVRFAVNPRPQDGQGTSIAAGVAALKPWTTAALIALGDQPRMPAAVVPALLDAFRRSGQAIVAPVYQGVHGTPVLFSSEVFGELRALTGDAGARAVVKVNPERVEAVAFDIAMPPDVDTPEDYAKLHVQ